MKPQVGEYWYIETKSGIFIYKVISLTKDGFITYTKAYSIYGTLYTEILECQYLAKWQPNFFWRLLGYK